MRSFVVLVFILVTIQRLDASGCSGCKKSEYCSDGKCVSKCKLIEDSCVTNAHCMTHRDHAACVCKPGFTGSGTTECHPVINPTACKQSDAECQAAEKARLCPFIESSCGRNAHCAVFRGRAACVCNHRHTGNPLNNCEKIPGCEVTEHCEPNYVCEHGACVPYKPSSDLCRNQCGNITTTDCNYYRGEAICSCRMDRATGDPYRQGCKSVPGHCLDSKDVWDDSNPGCKKHYLFVVRQVRWHEAHRNCIAEGMKLASIRTKEEQTSLETAISDNGKGKKKDWWLGAISMYAETDYRWINAGFDRLVFTNWGLGQPSPGTAKDCVLMAGDLRWYNKDCKLAYGYVCEYFGEKKEESVAK